MLKTIIIADDSTGANASAILLNKLNFKTLSLIDHKNQVPLDEFDAVAVSTDSRAIDAQAAYDRVFEALQSFKDVNPLVVNKRVDSTLRGNLGSELNAFFNHYPNKKVAVVPAFPNSKRFCIDGIVYVDQKKLEDTDVAKDPKMPIYTSNAKELFQKQTDRSITNIYLHDIRHNDQLGALIKQAYENYDIIIFDAETNEDIRKISETLAYNEHDLICVDPGPLTFFYTEAMMNKGKESIKKFIYLIGSVVDTTFNQLCFIKQDPYFDMICIDPEKLVSVECDTDELNRVKDYVCNSSKQFVCISTTDTEQRKILNLSEVAQKHECCAEDVSKMINNNLAKILISIVENDPSVSGVFCSGGDTALGFLINTDAKGINLVKEVMPLSVFGKIVGGSCDGLPIITKGGMIGDHDAYIKIKEFFEEATKNE